MYILENFYFGNFKAFKLIVEKIFFIKPNSIYIKTYNLCYFIQNLLLKKYFL